MADLFENPAGLDGFEFIEFALDGLLAHFHQVTLQAHQDRLGYAR